MKYNDATEILGCVVSGHDSSRMREICEEWDKVGGWYNEKDSCLYNLIELGAKPYLELARRAAREGSMEQCGHYIARSYRVLGHQYRWSGDLAKVGWAFYGGEHDLQVRAQEIAGVVYRDER